MRGVRQARQDQEGAEQHQRRQTAFDGDAQAGLFGFAKSLGQLGQPVSGLACYAMTAYV